MKKIIAFSGSLRKDSFNTRLLHVVKDMNMVDMEIIDISLFPLFNSDLEADFPTFAQEVREKVIACDGVIFATPEYNRSISGVLKNAIDWCSRPYGANSFAGKHTLVFGASVGPTGACAAQIHLKQILSYLDMKIVGQPELYISSVAQLFNEEGALVDDTTKEKLKGGVEELLKRIG